MLTAPVECPECAIACHLRASRVFHDGEHAALDAASRVPPRPGRPPRSTDPRGRRRPQRADFLAHGVQEVPAGMFAVSAGLGADPAVLVHRGVSLALVTAALADGHTGLKLRPDDLGVPHGRAAQDPGGSRADIHSVLAQPDARDHIGQVRLAQVGIGIGDAGLDTAAERVDRRSQHIHIAIQPDAERVAAQHLPGVAHAPLCRRRGDRS